MPPQSLIPHTNNLSTQSDQHNALRDTALQLQQLDKEPGTLRQLAAWSNYKLAQLTFAPPDIHTLRRTAIIKNAIQHIYDLAPVDGLTEMTRWEFFTLESLDEVDMTQEDLETILSEYIQIMDSPKSISSSTKAKTAMDKDQPRRQANKLEHLPNKSTTSILPNTDTAESSFCFIPPPPPPSLPPPPPPSRHDTADYHPKGFRLNPKRISWTCDDGLPSFVASQHFAGELVSLFDMEFKVDITLDINSNSTRAPQLPELSHLTEKQQRRSSVDSFMRLIPAFESFQVDGQGNLSYMSKANKRTSFLPNGVSGVLSNRRISNTWAPARSSSLKYRSIQCPSPGSASSLTISPTTKISPGSPMYLGLPMSPESSGSLLSIASSLSTVSPGTSVSTPSSNKPPTNVIFPSPYGHNSDNTPLKISIPDRKPSLTRRRSIRKLVSMLGKRNSNPDIGIPGDNLHKSTLLTTNKVSFKPIQHPLSDNHITDETNIEPPYNAITTPFFPLPPSSPALLHTTTATAPSSKTSPSVYRNTSLHRTPSAHKTLSLHTNFSKDTNTTSSISPTEALQIYNANGMLLSPLSSITASLPSTRAQRRRSKSVPEIPLFIHTPINTIQQQRTKYLEGHGQLTPLKRTGDNTPCNNTFDHSLTGIKLADVNRKKSVSKKQSTQSVHAPAHIDIGHSTQQTSLKRSQTVSRQHSPRCHKMNPTVQETSQIGNLSKHELIGPALSSLAVPSISKPSFLKRMASFARRRKSVSGTNHHGISSPVSV